MRKEKKPVTVDFKNIRNQIVQSVIIEKPVKKTRPIRGTPLRESTHKLTPEESFLIKLEDLENQIDSFNANDLLLFFCHLATESNIKYVPSLARDRGSLKKLQSHYTNKEICLMLEFLFNSDQDYLDMKRTRPTVLSSSWQSTIYQDSLLWLEDAYSPKSKKNNRPKREWSESTKEDDITIGEWQ